MEYREIVSVTGIGGLYQLMSTKSDGAIVRNLADKTTKFISARQHNVTPLESIEIYTTGSNVRLHEVLQMMKEQAVTKPDAKAGNADIKKYFTTIFPQIDEDRVYVSDMKKMLKWYDILELNELLDFSNLTAVTAEGEEGSTEDGVATAKNTPEADAQVAEAATGGQLTDVESTEDDASKPTKKARAKKTTAETEGEEAPAKKTAAKKKKEDGEAEVAEGDDAPKKAARAPRKKKED